MIPEHVFSFFENECCLYNKGSKSIQRNFCRKLHVGLSRMQELRTFIK